MTWKERLLAGLVIGSSFIAYHEPNRGPVVHDLHCVRKYPSTVVHGQLYPGCISNGPQSKPLGTVWWEDNRAFPGDDKLGYMCETCAAIETARRTHYFDENENDERVTSR